MEGFKEGGIPTANKCAGVHGVERGKSGIQSRCGQQEHVGAWFI